MHVDNYDALRIWLIKVFSQISEAEPTALSKYVCILMKKDIKGKDPKSYIAEQLEVFLQDETKEFIEKLFKALDSKEYMSEDILAEINERREKKDKKKTKIIKQEKGDLKPIEKTARRSSRPGLTSPTDCLPVASGAISNSSNETEEHNSAPYQRPPPTQMRTRTPSPAPRRSHRPRSRSRSPVHRRRRDSREGYERGNYSQTERNQNFSNISTTNSHIPTRVGSYETDSSQSNSLMSQRKQSHSNFIPITPISSTQTPITLSQNQSGMGAAVPTITSGYTPSPVPPANNRRGRCRDFDEKGYCMRGDLCPFDHGMDPVVVETVNFGKVIKYQNNQQPAGMNDDDSTRPTPNEMNLDIKQELEPTSPVEEVRTLLTSDRGRQRPPINRPISTISRNVVEVPLVDDSRDEHRTINNITYDDDRQKGVMEKRVARFGSKSSPIKIEDTESSDVRSRLGNPRPQSQLANRGNGHFVNRDRRDFGQQRSVGNFNQTPSADSNCSLGVTNIPPGMNTIGHLNSHFSKFGEVTNIQISFGDDSRSAMITFKSPEDATKAYRSPEPILSNRFIRTYIPKDDDTFGRGRGRGRLRGVLRGVSNKGGRVPVKRRLGLSGNTGNNNTEENVTSSNAKRRLHHRLGRNFDESSSESDEDWGVPDDNPPPNRRRVTLDSNGGDEFCDDPNLRDAMEEMKRKEQLAERQEAAAQMRAEQLQALERMRKRKELRIQQIQLCNKMKEQVKLLTKAMENYDPDTPKRAAVEKTMKMVETQLSEQEKQLGVDLEGPTSVQNIQRKILELELEQYNREKDSQDTSDVKHKLADCRRRLAVAKRRMEQHGPMFPTRGQTKLDKRPRTLLIQAQQDDVSAKLLLTHIGWYGAQIEKYELQNEDKVLHVTFRSRMDAEFVSTRFHEYKGKPLRIEWGKTIERSPSISSDRDAPSGTQNSNSEAASGDTTNRVRNDSETHDTDPNCSSVDVSNSEQQKNCISLSSEGFVSYEDDYEDMMGPLDDPYDPTCDPDYSTRSPIVVRAESGSSSGEEETGDEEEADEGEGESTL